MIRLNCGDDNHGENITYMIMSYIKGRENTQSDSEGYDLLLQRGQVHMNIQRTFIIDRGCSNNKGWNNYFCNDEL